MTDDEYHSIEEALIRRCNKDGCAPTETLKSIIIEQLKQEKKAMKKVVDELE